jgi:hypothetical protein
MTSQGSERGAVLPQVPAGKFKRGPRLWRYAYKAEQSLSSLPWVILTAVVGAVVAAAVAAGVAPDEAVRNGQVIGRSSYLHVFWVAALGAFADVVFVRFCGTSGRTAGGRTHPSRRNGASTRSRYAISPRAPSGSGRRTSCRRCF